MTENLRPLLQNKSAMKIIALLAAQGFETRFIGGCVRDALIGRSIGDIDLATTASPEQIMDVLGKENIKTIPTGIDHGTITALIDSEPFEITTLRKDISTDGRHAVVSFTNDWLEDAERRDFTINALSVSKDGCLFDYFDGLKDIEQKHLRFIGDATKRIQEDYLRILRFFRFASVLDWQIGDHQTLQICGDQSGHLKSLSRERIQVELSKLLLGPGCLRVIEIMQKYKILSSLMTEPNFDHLSSTVNLERKYQKPDAFRRIMAMAGAEEPLLDKFMVLSRDNKKRIELLNKIDVNEKLSSLLYFFGRQSVKDFYFIKQPDWDFDQIQNWEKPLFPLKAEDIFHLTNGPGPEVGKLLKDAENHWVAADFKPSKQDLLHFLER